MNGFCGDSAYTLCVGEVDEEIRNLLKVTKEALYICLLYTSAARVEKLLRSAIANWEQKNERKAESGELFVTQIFVDGGATLKRMRPAPQGRGCLLYTSRCV